MCKSNLDFRASCVYTLGMDDEIRDRLALCTGFDWDEGNSRKNWIKHQVTPAECEQLYFNQPLVIQNDNKHSDSEVRYYALGKTDENRRLFIAFTIRKKMIRIISARDMSRKEKEAYERS